MEDHHLPHLAALSIESAGIPGSACEGGHDDELGHSTVPIIGEKPVGLSVVTPSVHNVSSVETDSSSVSSSVPESEEDVDPCREYPKCIVDEVYAIVDEALQSNNLNDVADKISRLGDTYSVPSDIVEHLFYRLAKSIVEDRNESEDEFSNYFEKTIVEWKPVLKHFIYTKFDEVGLIAKLGWVCSKSVIPFYPFPKILECLYKNGIVCTHAILYWEHHLRWLKGGEIFLNQAQDLIKKLKQEPHNFEPSYLYDTMSESEEEEEEVKDEMEM